MNNYNANSTGIYYTKNKININSKVKYYPNSTGIYYTRNKINYNINCMVNTTLIVKLTIKLI